MYNNVYLFCIGVWDNGGSYTSLNTAKEMAAVFGEVFSERRTAKAHRGGYGSRIGRRDHFDRTGFRDEPDAFDRDFGFPAPRLPNGSIGSG